jgi:electron transport complex protein RnfC
MKVHAVTKIKNLLHKSFRHGIHPGDFKDLTSSQPIRRMAFAPKLYIPLQQNIGTPSIAIVKPGEEVLRGQKIAQAEGYLSVPLHAPATGVIEDICLMPSAKGPKVQTIVLKVYQGDSQHVVYSHPCDPERMTPTDLRKAIQNCGLVGLGGATFPTHAKLSIPEGRSVDTLIVNGCECEPYLTTDHRVMLEHPRQLINGIKFAMKAAGAKQAVIGVEDNKPDAIQHLRSLLRENQDIRVQAVKTKYPQGAERLLIKALLGRTVPTGGHSYDVGVCSNNVGTLAQLGSLLPQGQGLIERVVTVAGPEIERPGNYIIPIGTPLDFVLQQVGVKSHTQEIILGGPMMGQAVSSLDTPVTKGVSGILVFGETSVTAETRQSFPCIKCGQCVKACPMHLNPAQLTMLAVNRNYASMEQQFHLNNCFECGCCAYVCPAGIPLIQYLRIAKAINRENRQKEAA